VAPLATHIFILCCIVQLALGERSSRLKLLARVALFAGLFVVANATQLRIPLHLLCIGMKDLALDACSACVATSLVLIFEAARTFVEFCEGLYLMTYHALVCSTFWLACETYKIATAGLLLAYVFAAFRFPTPAATKNFKGFSQITSVTVFIPICEKTKTASLEALYTLNYVRFIRRRKNSSVASFHASCATSPVSGTYAK